MASSPGRERDSNDSNSDHNNNSIPGSHSHSQPQPQPQPHNPFVKFRQFADAQIGSLLQGIIGLPSAFTRNPGGNARWADFDDDLRRRDEFQARRRELMRDSGSRGHSREDIDDYTEARAEQTQKKGAPGQQPLEESQNMQGKLEKEVPLYSAVEKSLFSAFLPSEDVDFRWMNASQLRTRSDGLRLDYFPFKIFQSQNPASCMDAVRYMAFNNLEESSTLRSDYSMLPYLLFSPYSPIKLSLNRDVRSSVGGSEIPQDRFPYHLAFEDLIRTTQGLTQYPRYFKVFPRFDNFSSMPPTHKCVTSMAWVYELYADNLLSEQSTSTVPKLNYMLPAFPFVTSKELEESTSEVARTEQDMYDRFFRWEAGPAEVAGALQSIFEIEREMHRDLESRDAKHTVGDSMESSFGSGSGNSSEKPKSLRAAQLEPSMSEEKYPESKPKGTPQDPEKVVSTVTTTESYTHEDGSIETSITVWKRFADGRESTTSTSHSQNAPLHDIGEKSSREPGNREEQSEIPKNTKSGWFWN